MEAAKIDQVCEALVDLGIVLRDCLHEQDEDRKVGVCVLYRDIRDENVSMMIIMIFV